MDMTNDMLLQILAAFLFTMGMLVVLLRRDTIMILLGIELLLNAANLSLVAFSNSMAMVEGQIQVFFVITIAAAESAIGLSIVVNLYRNFGSIKTGSATNLKG
ncbi:MAG TPA: NADH-quinone oxidoreductase subunit NuoK [Bacteriovoracaceae bacterium]|nr:NADH-quinone oxidoreductase subunit NuoK [Bacteriovoracaceae bacterium]